MPFLTWGRKQDHKEVIAGDEKEMVSKDRIHGVICRQTRRDMVIDRVSMSGKEAPEASCSE